MAVGILAEPLGPEHTNLTGICGNLDLFYMNSGQQLRGALANGHPATAAASGPQQLPNYRGDRAGQDSSGIPA